MPNKVDDFAPYRILLYVISRLEQIGPENGYNTTPAVYTEWDQWEESQAKHRLFVEAGNASPAQAGLGQSSRTQPQLTVLILGASRYETEHPRRLAMALEQDVRTAIHSDVASIRDTLGRGAAVSFDICTHDGGVLSPKKLAGFRLEVTFTWSQGYEW